MEKFSFLVLLCCVLCAFGQDYRLLNGTSVNTVIPGSAPIWTRTSPSSQVPPIGYGNAEFMPYSISNNFSPALYWGNTFKIINVRPQNDTSSTKRLSPFNHYAMENQSIAMEGQEYLIRPRGVLYEDFSGKRALDLEKAPNGLFTGAVGKVAVRVLTVSPDFAAFRLTNSTTPGSAAIAFFDSETINSAGASFTIWASNPSGSSWFSPGASGFNASDPLHATANMIPVERVDIEWLVACRWIANGTDCGDDLVGAGDICQLTEFGLCWARFLAPQAFVEFGDGDVDNTETDNMAPYRADNWAIDVSPRPLTLYNPAEDVLAFQDDLFSADLSSRSLAVNVRPGQNSQSIVIGLPLNDEPADLWSALDFTPTGTTDNNWLSRFMPGKDNAGGTVEVTIRAVMELPDTVNFPNQIAREVTHIQMVPSKVVLSKAQPTSSVYFTNITKPVGVQSYIVHFLITESAVSTETIANSSAAFGTFVGTYPNGAYSIPTVTLELDQYDFELRNFPPGDSAGTINMPILPQDLLDCEASGNAFVAQLSASPAAIGQEFVTIPFTIFPPGMMFWSCPPAGSKRQSSPSQLNSFTFAGSTTSVVFYVTTASAGISPVTLSFGTPVVSNSALLDPVASFAFAQNGTFTFAIAPNDIQVAVVNEFGFGTDVTGGPFANQDFYMQLQWTPATLNGFSFAISGLYTTFPAGAVVSNSGTTGTFTVPPGSTGFLAGPFRAQAPSVPDFTSLPFEIPYSISLVPQANGSSDHTWYRLASAIYQIQFSRSRFGILNIPDLTIILFETGQKSDPICVGPAYAGVLTATDDVWVTFVAEDTDAGSPIIVDPVIPTPGARPPNALRLNAANPVACFTLRYDTNWQSLGPLRGEDDSWSLFVQFGGNSTSQFYEVIASPDILLVKPQVSMLLHPSAFIQTEGEFLARETTLLWVSIPFSPPNGLNYNVFLNGATIVPVSNGAGRFTPSGELQQLWQITLDALPISEELPDHSDNNPQLWWQASLFVQLHGADAIFFQAPESKPVQAVARSLTLRTIFGDSIEVPVGRVTAPAFEVTLVNPVVDGLTVTPFALSNGAIREGLSFEPPSFTFTRDSVTDMTFSFVGEVLGAYHVGLSVSGPDAPLFDFDNDNVVSWITVIQRSSPDVSCNDESFLVGDTQRCWVDFGADWSASEDVVLTIASGEDYTLSKTVFDVADGHTQDFAASWKPLFDGRNSDTALGSFVSRLSGGDAWKFFAPEDYHPEAKYRTIDLKMAETNHVEGVRYTGYVKLIEGPAPEGVRIFLLATAVTFYEVGATAPSSSSAAPFTITFSGPSDGDVKYFEYEITAPQSEVAHHNFRAEDTADIQVNLIVDDTFAGSRFYATDLAIKESLQTTRRSLSFSSTSVRGNEHVTGSLLSWTNADGLSFFMVNRESPLYTIVASVPPENSITLTISHPALTFNGGQSAASLFFGPGQLSASFSFMPISMTTSTATLDGINVVLSGPDASQYEYRDILRKMRRIIIIPELGFSPIPSIPTDGAVSGLDVWLVDGLQQGFSYSNNSQFRLRITPEDESVYIEPSVLEFSFASLQHDRLSQTYSIFHTHPGSFSGKDSYKLQWTLIFGSGDSFLVNGYVPLNAQLVILSRYQLQPLMPNKLNFDWQHAAINLTRAPQSYLTLTPHGPLEDGVSSKPLYGGAHTGGGRIVFDPANVVFAPGQQVAHFMMRALPGSDQDAVYYRVLWEMDGEQDDLENYLDYAKHRTDMGSSHFATWHVASAVSMQLTSLLIVALTAILFLM